MLYAKYKNMKKIILISLILPISIISCGKNESAKYLQYPGNGVPHISKNKPVKILNNEINNFFADKEGFSVKNGRVEFDIISRNIIFKSEYKLIGPTLNLALLLSLNKGQIDIVIGDIKFIIFPQEYRIEQKGKILFKNNDENLKGISLEKGFVSNNKALSVARLRFPGGSLGEYVELNLPATIRIELFEGSKGLLKGWEWIRGLE